MHTLERDIVPDTRIMAFFTLETMELRESLSKKPYLMLTLSSGAGKIKGFLWKNPADAARCLKEKTFVKAWGYSKMVGTSLIINVQKIRIASPNEVDSDFFDETISPNQLELFPYEPEDKEE